MLLDEPTRGIDVNAKREIYALIDELARDGLGIVLVSSELPEILALADRILVLAEGRVTAEFCSRRSNRRKRVEGGIAKGQIAESQVRMTKVFAKEHLAKFQSLLALAVLLMAY